MVTHPHAGARMHMHAAHHTRMCTHTHVHTHTDLHATHQSFLTSTEPPLATLGASKDAFTMNENVTITCTARDGYPPVSSIFMTKNGELVMTAESDVLHVNTDTVVGTPFGEYICVAYNSVITVEKTVLLKEKGIYNTCKQCSWLSVFVELDDKKVNPLLKIQVSCR